MKKIVLLLLMSFALFACGGESPKPPQDGECTPDPNLPYGGCKPPTGVIAQELTTSTGGYICTYGAENYCLTARSLAAGAVVDVEPFNGSNNQKWNLTGHCSASAFCNWQSVFSAAVTGLSIVTNGDSLALAQNAPGGGQIFDFSFGVAFRINADGTYGNCLDVTSQSGGGLTTWSISNCISHPGQVWALYGFPTVWVDDAMDANHMRWVYPAAVVGGTALYWNFVAQTSCIYWSYNNHTACAWNPPAAADEYTYVAPNLSGGFFGQKTGGSQTSFFDASGYFQFGPATTQAVTLAGPGPGQGRLQVFGRFVYPEAIPPGSPPGTPGIIGVAGAGQTSPSGVYVFPIYSGN
jgi:hypothetical protein